MKKKFFCLCALLFVFFVSVVSQATYRTVSIYDIVLDSPVKVVRYDTTGDEVVKVTVVRRADGVPQAGMTVAGLYTIPTGEVGFLEYEVFWNTTNEEGMASFPVLPSPVGAIFRQISFFVEEGDARYFDICGNPVFDDRTNGIHLLLWYADESLPAQVQLVHPTGPICVCPCSYLILIYKVTNAWGDPMVGVEVYPVLGSELISACPLGQVSDVNGEVVFHLTIGCEVGSFLFQVKLGGGAGFIQSLPVTLRAGYDCP